MAKAQEQLRVELGDRGYDITVGDGLLDRAGELLSPILRGDRAIIVSDGNVAPLYLERLERALDARQIRHQALTIRAGEGSKSWQALGELMESLLGLKPDRRTALIALGGGVVGDVTGFAASILLRGVDFIQIPTTLLSQVDSSVGGKTGINSPRGKNLIGSFHQPVAVLADVAVLETLPRRELLAGYAEMLKYGLINDEKFFDWLDANALKLLSGDASRMAKAVLASCKAKAAVVAADERESGERALLNLGHTFAHAFEAETNYSDELLHGEAVAIGMMIAFTVSANLGLCKQADVTQLATHYKKVGLPATPHAIRPSWNVERLMEHFTRDKKSVGGAPTFILTRGIGKAFIAADADLTVIKQTLAEVC